MIPAAVLNDLVIRAQKDYARACEVLVEFRDAVQSDPIGAGAQALAVPSLEHVCAVYESRLEQIESVAREELADWHSYGGRSPMDAGEVA